MKNYLLIEKSKFTVSPSQTSDKYTLEGVFTEFDSENRNGRVYTRKEFQPHFDALKKVVESGTCVGELDHPKQFETTLKNVSHKIEDIWIDEANNRVMGRIKLLDTDAGKNAKALVDAGVPLHISSRAAGTVSENKSVKIHKLFTYDLVDTPGFKNAQLGSVNESFGFSNESSDTEEFSDFAIYEVEKQIKKDIDELNNKKETNTMEYIKESEFNKYTDFTKEAIDSIKQEVAEMKEIQESIIEQNDSIVDEYSNAKFKTRFDAVDEKISNIEKVAESIKLELESIKEAKDSGKTLDAKDETIKHHVGDKLDGKVIRAIEKTDDGKTSIYFEDEDEPMIVESELAKTDALQVGQPYKGKGNIRAIEIQSDGSTKIFIDAIDEPIIVAKTKVEDVIDNKTLQEQYNDLLKKFEAIAKWSEHVTETVSALEKWSDHSTETVSGIEKWSQHVTETVTTIETKINDISENKIEDKKETNKEINENKIQDFKVSIYNKLEAILEAKEQKATDNESLNESKSEKSNEKNDAPLWMQMIPAKYKETWKGLDETEQVRITKRANLFEFKTESAIRDFWNNELTKENLIKEEKTEISIEEKQANINERRMAAVKGYKTIFG